nr:MAG TPA: hypothetical protein [Caudoviricetes sp.]
MPEDGIKLAQSALLSMVLNSNKCDNRSSLLRKILSNIRCFSWSGF